MIIYSLYKLLYVYDILYCNMIFFKLSISLFTIQINWNWKVKFQT